MTMLGLLGATALLGQGLMAPGTPLRTNDLILFFGDSITWQGGFIDVLAQRLQASPSTRGLHVSLGKRGINGGKSNDLLNGCKDLYGTTQGPFAEVLKQERPSAVVVEIGINDVWHGAQGNPIDVYERNLRDLVADAKTLKVPVVLATLPLIGERPRGSNPHDQQLDAYSTVVRKVASESGAAVADLREAFVAHLASHPRTPQMGEDRGMLTYDGVHMLPAGNELIAARFETAIAKALRGRPNPATGASADQSKLPLIPWPTRVRTLPGFLTLRNPTIHAKGSALPVARVLAENLRLKTGVLPKLVERPAPDSIVLQVQAKGTPESYRIAVGKGVTLDSPSNRGLAWAGATLLQLAESSGAGLRIPKVDVSDRPARPYRGLMVDVARRHHSIDVLKQCVVLCHLYKIPYLQLHLSDDQSFTFPSLAFPALNTQNRHGGPSYTVEELKDLVQYAEDRGVAIVPEIDLPGHSGAMIRAMPELFKIAGTTPYEHHATINFVRPDVLRAIDTLIGEVSEVFSTSPYFHMGGDEADISLAHQHPLFHDAFRRLGLPDHSQHELFRQFLNQVNDMAKKRGKQLIVWEGFGRNPESRFPISKDILVMEFENAYYLPNHLLEDGYSLINASWTPLYVVNRHVWPARKVFEWDIGRFGKFSQLYQTTGWQVTPDVRRVQGAQVCSWEGPEEIEIQNLRRVAAAMSDRVWNPAGTGSYADFERRLQSTDVLLGRLVHPVLIGHGRLDAEDPNGFDVPCFSDPLLLELQAVRPGKIRFTLDGSSPTGTSTEYQAPFHISQSTTVRAAIFGPDGKRQGFESSMAFYHVPPKRPNLATGKAATASSSQGPQTPNLAVDDNLDLASSWWAGPWPQWMQVDLGKAHRIDRIEVFPYWDGARYYAYTVEISLDGETWSRVADRSQNTVPASSSGDEIRFEPRMARYVRVNMLRGSANEGVHIVELRVWEARAPDKEPKIAPVR